jgi:translation elongation factor EF-Tu-like GTPase
MGLFRRKDEIISPTQPPHLATLNGASVTPPAPAASSKRSTAYRPADAAPDLRFTAADAFTITGRGTVVTGHVDAGWVRVRAKVEVVRGADVVGTWRLTAIERDHHQVELAQTGNDVGLLFKGADHDDLRRGDVLRAPAS